MYYRSVTVRVNEEDFTFTSDMITVKEYEKTVHVEEFIPSVIEPSFGVGRVMYSLFEVKNTTDTYYIICMYPAMLCTYTCSMLCEASR